MCEATAYLVSSGKEKEIMKDVVFVEVQGKHLTLGISRAMRKNSRPKSKKST